MKIRWALYGLVLAGIQGRQPRAGIIIHGQQLKTITLRLSSNVRKTRNLLEKIKDIQKGWEPPLILNDHCHICEFRQRCLQNYPYPKYCDIQLVHTFETPKSL